MKICFVCGKPIRRNPFYVGKDKSGNELYRHKSKCKAGTRSYQKFQRRDDEWNNRYFSYSIGSSNYRDVNIRLHS